MSHIAQWLSAKTLKELIPAPSGCCYTHRELWVLHGILLARVQEHPEWKGTIGEVPVDDPPFEIWLEDAAMKVHPLRRQP